MRGGVAATMATAVETPTISTSSSFSRSHSSPELASLNFPYQQLESSSSRNNSKPPNQRSDNFDFSSFDSDFKLDNFDSAFLAKDNGLSISTKTPWQPEDDVPKSASAAEPPPRKSMGRSRTGSLMERPRSWFPGSKGFRDAHFDPAARPSTEVAASAAEPAAEDWQPDGQAGLPDAKSSERTKTSDTIANFAKRSFLSSSSPSLSSMSPAPKRRPKSAAPAQAGSGRDQSPPPPVPRRPSVVETEQKLPKNKSAESFKSGSKPFTRASSYLTKIKAKQPKAFMKFSSNTDSDNSCASSATSLALPSQSTEARTSQSISGDSNTTAPDELPAEVLTMPRDTLWSSFKNLEIEYKSFMSKPTGQRIAQVQNVVLPFLRNSMNHSCTKELSPEDVDRRAQVLNKWWGGMLELLDGQGQNSIPGVDRPVLFEALTIMMMRPEWRLTTIRFVPLADRATRERANSTGSGKSTGAESTVKDAAFLVESAEHNIRTMFVMNLVNQLAFAVDKMSYRQPPMSLVSFTAKTCAFAFFFVPGVADMLVRLWGLTPELIRRAADELGLPRRNTKEGEHLVSLFPSTLTNLGWTSSKNMTTRLRQVPQLPVLVGRVGWQGPWVSRWKGRDTDLLFLFTKYFFILSEEFMPADLSLKNKAWAPGFVLVQAQLLSVVDSTIHRQSALKDSFGPALSMMDQGPGADATAMSLPMPPSNLMKDMSENRLICLLKDMLSDDAPSMQRVKHTFAETCASMVKAAVRMTSQFNNHACFTLCDFLEEMLTLYDEAELPIGSRKYIDWPFWMDVLKRIFNSMHTMSEVRVLSFIFTVWDIVTKDPKRKASFCLDWLLSEETFDTFFNHWCPMVRSYYHRLLCWRICRDQGKTIDAVDQEILETVAKRLNTVWAHYLYLKQDADDNGRFPPSTAPLHPTPGKKFMIIRQEVAQPQPGLFISFDAIAKTPGSEVLTSEDFGEEPTSPPKTEIKKKWGLLGKMFGQNSDSKGHNRKLSWDDEFIKARREAAESRIRPGLSFPPPKPTSPDDLDSACSSPMYEEQKYVFRFLLSWLQHPVMPPRDRIITHPRLPCPAQARLNFNGPSGAPPPPMSAPPPPPGVKLAPTRSFSGSPEGGLIQAARNASPLEVSEDSTVVVNEIAVEDEPTTSSTKSFDSGTESGIQPKKPVGHYVKNAIYTGRALAEWGIVIFECNNFIDRRQDEGVQGLAEVEVPTLGVDSFRRMGN